MDGLCYTLTPDGPPPAAAPAARAPAGSPRAAYAAGYQRGIRARYDSAETTAENVGLWVMTDFLSARAANSFQVRRQLKIRSRYEVANNSYLAGIVRSIANDLVGPGPRLQLATGNRDFDKAVEAVFLRWQHAVGYAEKLRTMSMGKVQDGEGFGLLTTRRQQAATVGGRWTEIDSPVQLDLVVVESDQVTTPDPGFYEYFWVDGVVLDRSGNPTEYHILRHHPGDLFIPQLNPLVYDKWPVRYVCHWLRKDRPGQVRGVPETTPSLELGAQLRKYTKAVIQAAETAADFAAVLETEAPADAGEPALTDQSGNPNGAVPPPQPFEALQIERGMLMTLPANNKLSQLKAEQPATTYEMFVRLIVREMCRCLNVPLNVALGDSSGFNYSSGRLDHLNYHRGQRVDRGLCDREVNDKAFAEWYAEARLVRGVLPHNAPAEVPPHRWFWRPAESIDPAKDATADGIELGNHTTTLAAVYGERGEDWEEAVKQRGVEAAALRKAGLLVDPAPPAGPTPATPATKTPEKKGVRAAARRRKRHGLAALDRVFAERARELLAEARAAAARPGPLQTPAPAPAEGPCWEPTDYREAMAAVLPRRTPRPTPTSPATRPPPTPPAGRTTTAPAR
jgi:capsid protein